jgi:hypothetical protein
MNMTGFWSLSDENKTPLQYDPEHKKQRTIAAYLDHSGNLVEYQVLLLFEIDSE